MTNQEHKERLIFQISTCLNHVDTPSNYTTCYIGKVDKEICKSVNLLLVDNMYVKLIPTEDYFNYLSNGSNKIEF